MKVHASLGVMFNCDMGQHLLCPGARVLFQGSHKDVVICTCSCHATEVHDQREYLTDRPPAEPTQIKLSLTGVTFPY